MVLNILLWVLVIWKVRPQEEPLFLHYNIYFGIDLLGSWQQFYLMPASGTVILLLNSILAILLPQKEKIISHFLAAINIIAQIVLIVACILIILLNF